MSKSVSTSVIPDEIIINKIFYIRGHKVMLDRDLAELYGVETKVLKQAVKRNIEVFPEHFMFELTDKEFKILRSQSVTSSWGGQRYLPFVFTEHGVLQLANVVKSKRAKTMSIRIIEVFVRMRETLLTHKDILLQLESLEKKLLKQDKKMDKYGRDIELIFAYLKELLNPPQEPRKKIGYKLSKEK